MNDVSQKSNKFESSCPCLDNIPNTADVEHLKKAVIGAYYRIHLVNESYRKDYISYKEWHKRLEEEIALIQAYHVARTQAQEAAKHRSNCTTKNI